MSKVGDIIRLIRRYQNTEECRVKITCGYNVESYNGRIHKAKVFTYPNSTMICLSDDYYLEIENGPELSSKKEYDLLLNKSIQISRKKVDKNGKIRWSRYYPI